VHGRQPSSIQRRNFKLVRRHFKFQSAKKKHATESSSCPRQKKECRNRYDNLNSIRLVRFRWTHYHNVIAKCVVFNFM
jgi:hypothetical protein